MVSKKTEPGTELERTDVIEASAGIVARQGDVIGRIIAAENLAEPPDAEATYRAIIEQILTAPDLETVLTISEAVRLTEIVDRPMRIHGINFNDSDFEQGAAIYVSIRAEMLDDGERIIANTSWQAAMAQLIWIQQRNMFPVDVIARNAKRQNRYGNFPIRFEQVKPANG